MTIVLLRSESPSGKCAKLHTVSASNNRDHLMRLLYYCLFAPHVYMGVVLRAHPVRGESHIQCNASGEVATTSPPFHNKPHRSYILFCKACSWHDLHILVTAPFGHPVFFRSFFGHRPNFIFNDWKKFGHNVWKGRKVNTVLARFNIYYYGTNDRNVSAKEKRFVPLQFSCVYKLTPIPWVALSHDFCIFVLFC